MFGADSASEEEVEPSEEEKSAAPQRDAIATMEETTHCDYESEACTGCVRLFKLHRVPNAVIQRRLGRMLNFPLVLTYRRNVGWTAMLDNAVMQLCRFHACWLVKELGLSWVVLDHPSLLSSSSVSIMSPTHSSEKSTM